MKILSKFMTLLIIFVCYKFNKAISFNRNRSYKKLIVVNDTNKTDKHFDLFLLIGQSNMAGRASIDSTCMDTLRNVYLFNRKTFEPATNPLNKYSTVRKRLSMQKLGPGYSFGKKLAKYTGRKIGLVVNARGGTRIEWWEKGYSGPNDFDLYENAIKEIKKAEKYGTLKAIIWHQGEANQSNSGEYMTLLKKLVRDLRFDLGQNVYFVAGELGKWRSSSIKINKVLDKIPDEIANADCVSAGYLKPLYGDTTNPHFNTKSQLILGQRYANNVLKEIYDNVN